MDSKQNENNCSSSLIEIEKLVFQASNINAADAVSFEAFDRKFKLLNLALNEIKELIECKGYNQLLKLIQYTISNFGYEIAYNKTFETQAQLLHKTIVFKLLEIAEASLNEIELSPFLKEKSMYIWDEPERSMLLKRIKNIENKKAPS